MLRRFALSLTVGLAACGDSSTLDGFPPRAGGPAPVTRPASCGETDYPAVAATSSGIVNGTLSPSSVPMTRQQRSAVVSVWARSLGVLVCSGTYVSPRTVLTAAHCVDGFELEVRLGDDGEDPIARLPVTEVQLHPEEDVALLQLEDRVGDGVSPLPIASETAAAGRVIELAGFGQREDGIGAKRFVASPVERVTATRIFVQGGGRQGVCFGDSGGPALWLSPETQRIEVLGVLSAGDATCTDVDQYARVDRVRAWIEARVVDPPDAFPRVCSDGLTAEGACTTDGGVLTCEDGQSGLETCPVGTACAWSNAEDRYRCLDEARWACGEVTQLGRCDGDVLTWCDAGVLNARDCSACGGSCRRIDADGRFGCADATCADVPTEGRCARDVVEYCDAEGRLRQLDCRGVGQVCAETARGARCVVPEGLCDAIGFEGTCVDDVAVYCIDDAVRWENCAASGSTCGFISASIGYYCR